MAIDWNRFMPDDGWKVLGAVGAILVALGGAGAFVYALGKDINQGQLDQYKAATEAKLPEVTSALRAVNKDLRESLDVFGRNKALETENASYKQQLAEAATARANLDVTVKGLRDDLGAASDREKGLREQIAKLIGNNRRFMLSNNTAEILGEGHSVGVAGNDGTTKLVVALDNKEYRLSASNSIPVELSDRQCVLTLLSFEWVPPAGIFDWSCKNK